jgi:S1-C subfamily serine protease
MVLAGAALLLFIGGLGLWGFLVLRPQPPVTPPPTSAAPPLPTSPATPPPTQSARNGLDPEDAFSVEVRAVARCATVRVLNETTGDVGSGVLLGRKVEAAYVLTADHVTRGGQRFAVSTFSLASFPRPANVYNSVTVLPGSPAADLAILRVAIGDDPLPGKAPLCPPEAAPKGAFFALTVGCDEGRQPISVVDKVLARRRVRKPGTDETALYWEVAGKPEKGRSGGPLLDRQGRVIGVASGVGDEKGYYTHAEEIHAFLTANGLKWLYEVKNP